MTEEINKEEGEKTNTNTETTETTEKNNKNEEKEKEKNNKLCAILAYFAVGIIWYFVDEKMRKNDFAKFHVKQALGLVIAEIVLAAALTISVVGIMAMPLLQLASLVLAIIGILNAVNGEKKELPIIGLYSNKYLKF